MSETTMKLFSGAQISKFERIFLLENKDGHYGAEKQLDDDDYIDYHIWEDANAQEMYTKHMPKTMLCRGNNPNIIFHGGCLGCLSQRIHGIDRCRGCMYFKFTDKPNLFIEGEDSAKMSQADLDKFLRGDID